LLVLVLVTFFVAWLLEDILYYSLFSGIPCGIIAALVVFISDFYYVKGGFR
jgi:hypothetical protein